MNCSSWASELPQRKNAWMRIELRPSVLLCWINNALRKGCCPVAYLGNFEIQNRKNFHPKKVFHIRKCILYHCRDGAWGAIAPCCPLPVATQLLLSEWSTVWSGLILPLSLLVSLSGSVVLEISKGLGLYVTFSSKTFDTWFSVLQAISCMSLILVWFDL